MGTTTKHPEFPALRDYGTVVDVTLGSAGVAPVPSAVVVVLVSSEVVGCSRVPGGAAEVTTYTGMGELDTGSVSGGRTAM